MTHYELQAVTLSELGHSSSRSIAGRFDTKADALAAAVDYGQELAGPVRDDYRRPVVAIENDETFGLIVKVGSANVDGEYTVIYVEEHGRLPEKNKNTGRGYVVCKI